ncbi:MarR family winged helix-turn-helix transcriptional regulator [Paraburkholderia phenazinium]|uniref:Transcriptional regulator, MarR family n=1 Tax=Paraburkholderia phenazinium TaxID=60549 RepID=A0A1N6I9N8_9BURK|nr:MarR family transcriptional regulator [Paraburkholderia phenazinium]SIO28720.1 transcriptional regulator, MarR family [Paraburkholderia phenazinium]
MKRFDLESALPYLLNRAGVGIGQAFSDQLAAFDINLPMWRVLASLLHQDGQRVTALSDHTSIEVSTLSRLVTSMEKRELLRRTVAPDDARAVSVTLTEKARDLAWKIVPLAELYERIALAHISPEEAVILKRLLTQVHENIASVAVHAKPTLEK